MRSKYGTQLSLTEFFEYTQMNRWLGAQFNQYRDLNNNTLKPIQKRWRVSPEACDDPFYEELYMNGKSSREEISRAIRQAEEEFALVFGYSPSPLQYTDTVKYADFYDVSKSQTGGMYTPQGKPKCFELKWAKAQTLGVYVYTFLDYYTGALADLNDDGVQETIVVSGVIAPLGTTCQQLEVYFRDTDFAYGGEEDNVSPEPQWRIYPIEGTVTTADNGDDTMTWEIRFFAYEGVKPNKQLTEFPQELTANVSNNFSTSFRVFTKTIDTTIQGALIYDKFSDCTRTEVDNCFILKEEDIVCPKPTGFDSCTTSFPDSFEVHYIAGCDLQPCGRLDYTCGMIVTMLAAARLACEPCGCGCHGKFPLHWYSEIYKERMSEMAGKDVWILGDPAHDRQNPFGPRNGDVMAWRFARNLSKKKIHNIIP